LAIALCSGLIVGLARFRQLSPQQLSANEKGQATYQGIPMPSTADPQLRQRPSFILTEFKTKPYLSMSNSPQDGQYVLSPPWPGAFPSYTYLRPVLSPICLALTRVLTGVLGASVSLKVG